MRQDEHSAHRALGLPEVRDLERVELELPAAELERARAFAEMRSLSCQAYLIELIRAGLDAEASRTLRDR